MSVIGIIGGNGTLATLDLLRKIVDNTFAESDSDQPHFILENLPPKKADTFVYDGKKNNLQPAELIESAKRLEKAGASFVIIPCNSQHYFYDDIQRNISINVLSIIEVCVKKIVNSHPKARNVCVLATSVTMKKGLYRRVLERNNLKQLSIPDHIQDKVMKCVYGGDKESQVKKNSYIFQEVIDFVEKGEADVIIAGCTEVPLFLDYLNIAIPVIDSTNELAKAAAKLAGYKLAEDYQCPTLMEYNSHYSPAEISL